jgi:hypothetical protein
MEVRSRTKTVSSYGVRGTDRREMVYQQPTRLGEQLEYHSRTTSSFEGAG